MIDEKMLLEERPEWLNPNRIGKEEYHKGWNECNKYWCNTIKSQPKVGEWIPVSERLPEDDGLVLVTVNDKHNNLTFENALMTGCYCCAEGWILEGHLDWIDPNVTAWMPLPEPMRSEERDG